MSLWAKLVSVSKLQFILSGMYIIKGTVTVPCTKHTLLKKKILLFNFQNFNWYILSNMQLIVQNTHCCVKKRYINKFCNHLVHHFYGLIIKLQRFVGTFFLWLRYEYKTFTIVDNIVDGNMKFTKVEASQIVINRFYGNYNHIVLIKKQKIIKSILYLLFTFDKCLLYFI